MTKKPNIIFILSDQHNPKTAGYAGDQWVRTPHLDRLAAGGVVLENCYCPSPLCVPSRASMLAGLLPRHTGVYNNMQALRSDQATFVTALAVGGYETVLAGRMHFVGPDQRHGYETRLVGDITPTHIGAANDVYGVLKGTTGQERVAIEKSGPGHSAVLDFDQAVTDAACAFLRGRGEGGRPLFLTVGLYGPHCPYVAPPELFRRYYDALPVPRAVAAADREKLHPAMRQWCARRQIETLSSEEMRRARAAYYGLVERMDSLIGRILAATETLDPDNTLVLYASDHGDGIGHHGLFWKSNFYDDSCRVPLIASWPGRFAAGARLRGVCSLLDLAPTLLGLAGGPPLPAYDGRDIAGHLSRGEELPPERAVVSECSDLKGDPPSAMLRRGRYKLIRHAGFAAPQLFDMEADPEENADLGGDPGHADTVASLDRELARHWQAERAVADLEVARAHFRLMKQWTGLVRPASIEKWRGDSVANHIESV